MTDKPLHQPGLSRAEFIGLMAALMALNALAIDVMLPALPVMGADLGVTVENERQLVMSAYMVAFGIGQLFFGPISDRFGRRGPLFFGLALYVTGAFAALFATDFAVLLALRFLQGIGAASTRVIATSVVRDRYSGRDMAQIMSLTFMVFMAMPIFAPSIGQLILLAAPWQYIFIFMGGLATIVAIWCWFRLPETLARENRRAFTPASIFGGFRIVLSNRSSLFYGLAGIFMFGSMFSFIVSMQQIFVDIYGLGVYFPLAFAALACIMSLSSFLNSRFVQRFGMRRLSHTGILVFLTTTSTMLVLSLTGQLTFWLFIGLLACTHFVLGWITSNMNSLAMEPLGRVAGTAAAVFGFSQTVGGAMIGTFVGQQFNGTVTPLTMGYVTLGLLVLSCVLIAEKGRLFGVGEEYRHAPAAAD